MQRPRAQREVAGEEESRAPSLKAGPTFPFVAFALASWPSFSFTDFASMHPLVVYSCFILRVRRVQMALALSHGLVGWKVRGLFFFLLVACIGEERDLR